MLRPGLGADAQDHMLDGRTATIERIYLDYDDQVHLASPSTTTPARS